MFGIWKEDIMDNAKFDSISLYRFISLNIKTIYSTWATRIIIILSPILVTLALACLMPLHYYIGAGQIFVTTLSAGTIWGMTYFSFRKSLLYSNIKGTRNSNLEMYLAILVSMLLVTFCSEVLFWVSSIVFYYIVPISLFEDILKLIDRDYKYVWSQIDWVTLVYVWVMSVLLMFSTSFLFRGIVNTEKNYFIILFMFVMVLFPFGGLLRPNLSLQDNGIIFGNDKGWTAFQWFSAIFPQTHLNYFSFAAVSSGTLIEGKVIGGLDCYSSWIYNADKFSEWDFVILYPFISLTLLSIISLFTINKDY